MSLGNLWNTLHPLGARLFGGSGRQPNTAAPRWNEVSPGRWEMEGGTPPGMGPSTPQPPPMQTGGPGQVQQFPEWLTGGPGQQFPMQAGDGIQPMPWRGPTMTGGGMPPMGGGSFQPPQWGMDGTPYDGGFQGNFGPGRFR